MSTEAQTSANMLSNSHRDILFLNQSAGYLMIDIIHAFADVADKRVLLAGSLNPRNNPLDTAVKVEQLLPYDRSSTFRRLYTWGMAFIKALWLIQWRYRGYHLFLVSNPPMATLLPLFCRNSYSLLVYDVYPDALAEYRIVSAQHPLVRWWKKANTRIYRRASRIYTLSEGMKRLMAQYTPPERIEVVPVWTDNDFLQPIAKSENPFVQEQGLTDKFVVQYSGNLGKTHEISLLVDLAEELADKEDLFFLIIGGGDQYKALEARIAQSGLANIRLLPWQPTELLPYTLATADLGVVSLGKEASRLSMPSKTFNLLSVACPILGIAGNDSALHELIEAHGVGRCFETHQKAAMRDYILQLCQDGQLHQQYREKALATSRQFGPENARRFVQKAVIVN